MLLDIFPNSVRLERGRHYSIVTPTFRYKDGHCHKTVPAFVHSTLLLCRQLQGWRIISLNPDDWLLQHHGDILRLDETHAGYAFREWKMWKEFYLPPFGLEGMTILDVGAGCGETAHFFFEHGAARVVAIEPDRKALRFLRENSRRNKWHIRIVPRPFRIGDLQEKHDFMKMDGEGCERLLLRLPRDALLKPSVIEAHNVEVTARLVTRFNLRPLRRIEKGIALLSTTHD